MTLYIHLYLRPMLHWPIRVHGGIQELHSAMEIHIHTDNNPLNCVSMMMAQSEPKRVEASLC
jgi:hypothetical protein